MWGTLIVVLAALLAVIHTGVQLALFFVRKTKIPDRLVISGLVYGGFCLIQTLIALCIVFSDGQSDIEAVARYVAIFGAGSGLLVIYVASCFAPEAEVRFHHQAWAE